MNEKAQLTAEGYDIVINGTDRLFAELELSAIAAGGFPKEHFPDDVVHFRARADGKVREVWVMGN